MNLDYMYVDKHKTAKIMIKAFSPAYMEVGNEYSANERHAQYTSFALLDLYIYMMNLKLH